MKRSFESAIESAEEQKIDAELKLNDLEKALVKEPERAKSILNEIVEEMQLISDADNTIEFLKKEQDKLFN